MQTAPLYQQMSYLDSAEPLWCERTQDMSGYVLPDTISLPSDEHFHFTFSTAQTEHDFDMQNSGNPSPEEFILGDQTNVLGEDSIMFDNSNYSELHSKMKAWLPKMSNIEINEFAKTNMVNDNGYFLSRTESENSVIFQQPTKEENRPSATDAKHRHLSIFDSEEPHIKEEPDILSSCCTDSKLTFDELRDEMEVAEEVVVTTEVLDESKSKMFLGSFFFDSASPEYLVDPKDEIISTSVTKDEISSPLSRSSLMETPFDFDTIFTADDDLYNLESSSSSSHDAEPSSRLTPQLRLDIEAATMVSPSQLLSGGLPDTPEVLKPVLKPEADFDLVSFLLANGDSNNNRLPTTPVPARSSERPCFQRIHRRGKSHLSISDLKESQKYGRGKPSPRRTEEESESSPAPSTSTVSSNRPARKSATKFKRLLEEGLLDSTLDSHSVSSEDEDSAPKTKRRRRSVSSTSSRRRLNSDSDRSSVCEYSTKYRERRDRNNLSSKRSRQKRKMQQELKKEELKVLEGQNRRLKRRADELAAIVGKVHKAWKEYLEKIQKD